MKLRIIVRVLVGLILAVVIASMGVEAIKEALSAETCDRWMLAKGIGYVSAGVLMIAALVISHRARQRIAKRQRRVLEQGSDADGADSV